MDLPISDINYLNIIPYIGNAAEINNIKINFSGGNVRTGNYIFALRYIDSMNTPTNFFAFSSPVAVPLVRSIYVSGTQQETPTSCSIQFNIDNLDTEYSYFQIAVIPQYKGVLSTPLLMPYFSITSESQEFIYDGGEQAVEISLEEIVINLASYDTSKTIAQVDDILYLGNLTREKEFNYQPYANNIKLKVVNEEYEDALTFNPSYTARMDNGENGVASPSNLSYKLRGFKRGEVYAFYISFLFKDGTESPAFHIPGRPPGTFSYNANTYNEDAPVDSSQTDLLEISGVDGEGVSLAKWFHFISRAHENPSLGTGYWENRDEIYPDSPDWEIWDVDEHGEGFSTEETLAGKKVRHHQMPDDDQNSFLRGDGSAISVLGIQLDDVKIPNELKERVKAIRIHYAKRTINNQRIIDQSCLIRTGTYTSGGNTVSYPLVSNFYASDSNEHYEFLVHPFNTLRLNQSINTLNYLKGVFKNDNDPNVETPSLSPTPDIARVWENMIPSSKSEVPEVDRFRKVLAASYLPSYGFNADGVANSLVQLSNAGFAFDFDNTNGEEKIIISINPLQEKIDTPNDYLFPEYLYDLCQLKFNMYLNFDMQTLTYTGFQDSDIDKYGAGGTYSTGPIFGGDTYIGVWNSRHTQWYDYDEPVFSALRYNLVECYAFPDWRSPGEQVYEWSPGNSSYISIVWKDGKPSTDKEGDVFPSNTIYYNEDYVLNNTIKPALPFLKRRTYISDFPTRIIRSIQGTPSTQVVDTFRQFRENDFRDLPTHRGEINKLVVLNNLLLPHLEYSLFRTKGKEEFATGDVRAFIGSGDIFEMTPEEIYQTELGYGGLLFPKSSLVTEYGYFFLDYTSRKIFHLTPEGLVEISAHGMEGFFKDNIPFNFEYLGFTPQDKDSHYFSFESAWDAHYKRYLFTKRDIKFNPDFSEAPVDSPDELVFNTKLQKFVDPENNEDVLEWSDTRYFTPEHFTISYSPELSAWVSFHDYFPSTYFYNNQKLFSSLGYRIGKHNDPTARGKFYEEIFESFIEYVDARNSHVSKLVSGLFINTEVYDTDGLSIEDETVTSVRVSNTHQDTGDIEIDGTDDIDGNVRKAQGFWRINQLRNIRKADGSLDPNMEWYEKEWLSGRYHYVKLSYDNSSGKLIYIVSSELNTKASLR